MSTHVMVSKNTLNSNLKLNINKVINGCFVYLLLKQINELGLICTHACRRIQLQVICLYTLFWFMYK